MTTRRWGIIGGGMLGLTVAHRLAQQGHQVTVLEATPELGGLASAWSVGGITWDRFYHVVMLSDRWLRRILGELGLDDGIDWKVTRAGFFTGKGLYQLNNAIDYAALALGLIDKFRLNWYPLHGADRGRPAAGSDTAGGLADQAFQAGGCSNTCGGRCRRRSWATTTTRRRRRRSSGPTPGGSMPPARRGGMKTEMFGYVPGGYARILRALCRAAAKRGRRHRDQPPGAADYDGGRRLRGGLARRASPSTASSSPSCPAPCRDLRGGLRNRLPASPRNVAAA
ncbi:MAG: FAD-dependent oxidoreductase [Rhodospirillales bacterium]